MNLLITGGAGFIGSNLIRDVIDRLFGTHRPGETPDGSGGEGDGAA